MANTVLKTNNNNQTQLQAQLMNAIQSMVESVANAEEEIIIESPFLLQLDDNMDDGNISKDDDETSVLSLNLFDVESVFDSDTDSDDEVSAYSCLPSLDLSTADDFYQDEDGTFIAVDYDEDEEEENQDDDMKQSQGGNDMVIMEDYHSQETDDKFIVTIDGDIGYSEDFEDHNERNMVYLANAYSNNTTTRNSISMSYEYSINDHDNQYGSAMDTPITPFTPSDNTNSNCNSNPFANAIPSWNIHSSSNYISCDRSRPEMDMNTNTKSEDIEEGEVEYKTAQEIENNEKKC